MQRQSSDTSAQQPRTMDLTIHASRGGAFLGALAKAMRAPLTRRRVVDDANVLWPLTSHTKLTAWRAECAALWLLRTAVSMAM